MSQAIKNFGSKTLRFLHLEQPALSVLNRFGSRYGYPYLKGVSVRGEILFNIIKSNLKPGDNFLDVMCGYSPLAGPLLKSGYQITGFDDNRKAVKDLKRIYPEGRWILSSYKNSEIISETSRPFSVFLLLGAFELCCQPAFVAAMDGLLKINKPRMFFLETNRSIEKAPSTANPFVEESAATRSVHLKGYNAMLKLLIDHGYKATDVGQYDAQFEEKWATIRIYAILKAKTETTLSS